MIIMQGAFQQVLYISLQKQIGCFNHRVVTLVANKLWL